MNLIQSSWACNKASLINFDCGWYAPEYNLFSWALSCLQLKKNHKEKLILFADSVSAKTLIDDIGLPYDEVDTSMDCINHYHPDLWALPKIYSYAHQDEPFLHIDADAYIWQPFSSDLLTSDLIAQNIEIATDYYENIMFSLEKHFSFFPKEILDDRKNTEKITAFNAGIFGGHDIDFFQEYTKKAFEFVDKNYSHFGKVKLKEFNVFYEQYLFYCLAKEKQKKVKLYLPEVKGGNEYFGFGDFSEIPHNRSFLHLLGLFKKNKLVCQQLADRLRLDYPEYYYRIICLFKSHNQPLKRNFYYFTSEQDVDAFVKRHQKLSKIFSEKLFKTDISGEKIDLRKAFYFETRFIVQDRVKAIIDENNREQTFSDLDFSSCLTDLAFFEGQVERAWAKFSGIDNDKLYARDIVFTRYFEQLFSTVHALTTIRLLAGSGHEIIESNFDWSEVDRSLYGQTVLDEQLFASPGKYQTAVIPECDEIGFSLASVDELDICILDILKSPATVAEVLNKMRCFFNSEDIESSESEFHSLIVGRIKKGLLFKLIKISTAHE